MKKKFLKIGVILVAVALALGLVLPGIVAADESGNQQSVPPPPPNVLKGKVVSIAQDKTSFDIKSGEKPSITIKVDSNTKYFVISSPKPPKTPPGLEKRNRIMEEGKGSKNSRDVERGLGQKKGKINQEAAPPQAGNQQSDEDLLAAGEAKRWLKQWQNRLRQFGEKAIFADIAIGDMVIVRIMPNENLAKEVLITKPLVINRVHGTIKAVSDNSITIVKADGTEVTLNWDENTRFLLKGLISVQAGQTATAVYNTKTMKAQMVEVKPTPPTPAPTTTSVTT